MMKNKLLIAALASAGLFASSAQADAVVDLFSVDQAEIKVTNVGDTAASQVGSALNVDTILGGYRDLYVELVEKAPSTPDSSGVSMSVGSGALSFNNDSGVKGFGEVVWDGASAYGGSGAYDFAGLGGIDLTAGGANSFLVETLSADANWFFEIIAFTDEDNWTKINFTATEVPTGSGPVFTTISFAGFTNAALCGTEGAATGVNDITCGAGGVVDFSNLGALVVRLNVGVDGAITGGAFDIDLRLASVTVPVPEPATLALVGLGLFAAGFAGRRRRQSIGS
jgi:hypothetical protein